MVSTVTPAIEVHDLTVSYRSRPVLWDIDFTLPEGKRIAIVGPNGAGKSTLLKSVMGLLPLSSGFVRIFGEPQRKVASLVAYVPQRESVDWDFPIRVRDVVMMGRYVRHPFYRRLARADYDAADRALSELEIAGLEERQISQLSGGQQQRVFLARAMAQEARLYLLDEPFAGVDAATERSIAHLFQRLADAGKTVICVHHDLNTVAAYFDYVILLHLRLVASGPVQEVFTPENLQKTYSGRLGLLTDLTEELRKGEWRGRKE